MSGVTVPISKTLRLLFSFVFVLTDIILSCVLLYLYLKKLSILIKGGNKHENKDTRLISLITRYTLLYFVCFASTFMVILISFILSFATSMDPVEELRFLMIFFSIDSCFNSFSLWLNMSFAQDWYFKLCRYGHDKCTKCFGGSTDEEIVLQEIQDKP